MCGAKHILNATINLDKTVTVDWIEGADAYYCSRELMEKIFDRFNETTALLTKLRDEVEKECKNSEHRKGSVTSIGANGNEMTFFEPVLCGACKNFLALLEKVDE